MTGGTVKPTPEDILGIIAQGGPLLRGRMLRCPACENEADLLAYSVLEYIERYANETVPVMRCRRRECRHVFALRPEREADV